MAADDEVTATLEQWRAIEQAATKGPWRAVAGLWTTDGGKQEIFPAVISRDGAPAKAETWLLAAGRGSPNPEPNAEFTAEARTAMPRLVAALDAVLKLAAGARSVDDRYDAEHDRFEPVAWNLDPAKVREAITRELMKEGSNG